MPKFKTDIFLALFMLFIVFASLFSSNIHSASCEAFTVADLCEEFQNEFREIADNENKYESIPLKKVEDTESIVNMLTYQAIEIDGETYTLSRFHPQVCLTTVVQVYKHMDVQRTETDDEVIYTFIQHKTKKETPEWKYINILDTIAENKKIKTVEVLQYE